LTLQEAAPSALLMSAPQLANWSWSFDVSGPSQTNYVLWSSTDLSHWSSLKTNFTATGSARFTESNSPAPVEFYRVTLSP
jgi:hypothetical protein